MSEYQKIPSPFKRALDGPNRNKLVIGEWSCPEFEALADTDWVWTEKVDGTNVRVIWDGHKPRFGGRTDNAQMPTPLLDVLTDLFTEELLEQQFGGQPAVLYGEGYGGKIQSGGRYRPDPSFALFDVRVDEWWLRRADVEDVGIKLGVDVVPLVCVAPISFAVDQVRQGLISDLAETPAEGLVGTHSLGLLNRAGERLIVKVKGKDFAPMDGGA